LSENSEIILAIVIANVSHFLSVIVLYYLTLNVFGDKAKQLAIISAILHSVSSASAFLLAPYSESSFALLSYIGYLQLAKAIRAEKAAYSCIFIVQAGVAFGLATTIRGNGLLFAVCPALYFLHRLAINKQGIFSWSIFSTTIATALSGVMVVSGMVFPQWIAYSEYCLSDSPAVWCRRMVPSIFSWVQSHYWNVGFLRYWVLPNIPLFLLAIPMLAVLLLSGWAYTGPIITDLRLYVRTAKQRGPAYVVAVIAAPQIILAVAAILMYHVQIILRLATGYPAWYWWLAQMLLPAAKGSVMLRHGLVLIMVSYSLVQSALYASFLPPA
jgi:phosphatidylinositol glycan class V